MSHTFTPPTADLVPPILPGRDPGKPLFRHYKNRAQGKTVIKLNGVYQTVVNPSLATLQAATEVYMGGHVHTVDDATAAALTAAGYTVT